MEQLATLIAGGMPSNINEYSEQTELAIDAVVQERYHKTTRYSKRIAFRGRDNHVAFAGLLPQDSPDSGPYGGMSLVWFPLKDDAQGAACSLLTFVCGTRGLAPDESILSRPGHIRHLRALARGLSEESKLPVWVKRDPANLGQKMPQAVLESLRRFKSVTDQYGEYLYAAVVVPNSPTLAQPIVQAFVDFFAWEREWSVLKAADSEIQAFKNRVRRNLFPRTSLEQIHQLLRERRFVILQGPPGTGKTRLSQQLLHTKFGDRGRTVQFHPAVTYESFVVGITPDVSEQSLRFRVRSGWLAESMQAARDKDYLLVIDEINRGNLGKVLGEAIYLFEAREINAGEARSVHLPMPLEDGRTSLTFPEKL